MHTSLQGKLITQQQIIEIARAHGFEYAALRAVIMVEGSGRGFDTETGKILIQFEPAWYRKIDALDGFSGHGVWEENKVEKQPGEWKAFNDAFGKDKDAAMQATSWGMMQVMGFHYKDLGFDSVGAMVDFAKVSEANQVELGVRFIKKSVRLTDALRTHDWKTFAYYYNGKNYQQNNYDVRLATHYNEATNTTA
jgi:hypothetical protein